MKKDDVISYRENVYDPLNQGIDEQNRILRSRSTWRYSKAFALGLVALGIFLVLAAYAYYFFNRHYFQRIDKLDQGIISSGKNVSVTTHRFATESFVGPGNQFDVTTRFKYSKTSDLFNGMKPKVTCYIARGSVKYEFEGTLSVQAEAKKLMGISNADILNMKKYCKYNEY